MQKDHARLNDRETLILRNQRKVMEEWRHSVMMRFLLQASSRLREMYADAMRLEDPREQLAAYAEFLNAWDEYLPIRSRVRLACMKDDAIMFLRHIGRRKRIDHSDRKQRDYFSVAGIIKNEARHIREFILFYKAVGADRIYLYDNGSTDELQQELEPFLQDGTVIYTRWPGKNVQAAAYRDAVRRARKRTKWLAVVDADEFLFSPMGSMPQQLKEFEQYPGVCANWVMFGPGGHDRRPEGMVMDNYRETLAEYDADVNCHIKSIYQPDQVRTITHTHYAYYKKGRFAVDETGEAVDNRNAIVPKAGRAFTLHNHRDRFRINHYHTKSLEDLEEKCRRGYADGAQNPKFKEIVRAYKVPMKEDDAIKSYADIVRKMI